jgi:4-hydroxy 2-oxovalerate aldolase
MDIKILDCTIRDGGYYTNWDFDKELIQTYFKSFNQLPAEYLEIGYRSFPMQNYLGEYFYCPVFVMEQAKEWSDKKLVIILNEKDIRKGHVKDLLSPCVGLITMVRLAIDPQNFTRALGLAEAVKSMGFEVGFNVMYMSTWSDQRDFLNQIQEVTGLADYFYMVDSFGGVYPQDVKDTFDLVKSKTDAKVGFHGHNNLELALVNTLTALECGADIVDATVTGMGRGAGNLKTELLFTALNAKLGVEVDFNSLSNVVSAFENLQKQHEWGTNLPYMVSGANSLPQKEVMNWVTQRFYSFNSIIRALQNQKVNQKDNQKLNHFEPKKSFDKVVIIGGGPNAALHSDAVQEFINRNENVCVIHASSKNAGYYKNLAVVQYFCLVGSEGHRLEKVFDDLGGFSGECVLPPFPRKMGTYIPQALEGKSFELKEITITELVKDAHTVLALQTALNLNAENIYLVGYDGYQEGYITKTELALSKENETIFQDFQKNTDLKITSLTPTHYRNLEVESIYSLLQ